MSIQGPKTLCALLAPVLLLATSSAALAGKPNLCQKSAYRAKLACKKEASAAYWLARAKCANLTDADAKEACVDDAVEELADALDECKEQYEARLDLCKQLGGAAYDPLIDPADYVPGSSNPLLPLVPGTTYVYEKSTAEGLETITYMVTNQTTTILGVECIVVHDVVDLDGTVIEDTFDWFAEDTLGNVWYFGELSYEYENGQLVGLAGSWTAGVDGAKPGIVMPAAPVVGDVYRQEFLIGEAEDVAGVLGVAAAASVPYGDFANCLQTEDYSPLEPGHVEHKFYAAGVGLVLEENPETLERTELVSVTP